MGNRLVGFFVGFFFLNFQRERKGGGERERNISQVTSHILPTGDLTHNPGMCHDWASDWQIFGSQDDAQSTEPSAKMTISSF